MKHENFSLLLLFVFLNVYSWNPWSRITIPHTKRLNLRSQSLYKYITSIHTTQVIYLVHSFARHANPLQLISAACKSNPS